MSSKVDNLVGAVPDAVAMKTYLENHLGVQPSQIHLLLNAQATRSAIIQGLKNLAADRRIKHGDPILFFYAGHGSEVTTPKDWKVDDAKVQMLLPYDYSSDGDGLRIHGIPDRTIGTFLSRIAEKKGDNIVRMTINVNNLCAADGIMCL